MAGDYAEVFPCEYCGGTLWVSIDWMSGDEYIKCTTCSKGPSTEYYYEQSRDCKEMK